jgi:hypothetical protein
MFKFIHFLKMKHFFHPLDVNLQRFLFDAPGVLQDSLFMSLLRAKCLGIEENVLLQRLNFVNRLTNRKEWSKNLMYQLEGVFSYEVEEVRTSIRKVKKYSGYVRNSSAVGSKRGFGTTKPEPGIFEWKPFIEEYDFFDFLSVGRFSTGLLSGKDILS